MTGQNKQEVGNEKKEILPESEIIALTVKYKNPVAFFLRMVSFQEEKELKQKFFDLPEAEKDEKIYSLNVELLAKLTVKKPDAITLPETVTVIENIQEYFAEKTIIKARIAESAVLNYFNRLQPTVDFL